MSGKRKSLRLMMCAVGWPANSRKPIPLECAECESFCGGGLELLQTISADDFRALLCGGNCETCRQSCNLRRIAIARNIKPEAVEIKPVEPVKPEKPKEPKRRKRVTVEARWIETACKPYFERMRENAN